MTKILLGSLITVFVLVATVAFWIDKQNGDCNKCDVVLVTVDVWNIKDQNKLKIKDGQNGYFFENAFASSNWPLPVYTSIFTGDYPANYGVWRVGDSIGQIPEGNFASRMSKLGYRTQAISVGPFFQKEWGFAQAFDEFDNASDFEAIKSAWNSEIINKFSDQNKDFFWIRLGMNSLVFDYESSIDQTMGELNAMLNMNNNRIVLVVAGVVGRVSDSLDNASISVPLFVSIPGNRVVDRRSVFETKDISKLILQEPEFVKSRQGGKSLVALSSSSESVENIKGVYVTYAERNITEDHLQRVVEWSEPNHSSSRSLNWHLIRDLDGKYYLYNMRLDRDEKNNLFESWNDLPADQRSEAIKVIRSIGSDVPEACGIYCGSHEFFK